MRRPIKNFLLIFLIAFLIFGFAPQSYAVVPTWDVGLNGQAPQGGGFGGGIGGLGSASPSWFVSKESNIVFDISSFGNLLGSLKNLGKQVGGAVFSWDGIASAIGRLVVSQLVADTVQWIQTGDLSGGPLFIQNPERYFENVADQASGVFLAELGEEIAGNPNFFCGPMPRLMLSLRGPGAPFQKRYSCTINTLQYNVTRFYNNFADGGWERFADLHQTRNSPFGVALVAAAEQERLVAQALGRSQQEASWSQGLIGIKECAKQAPQDPDFVGPAPCKQYRYKTPGQAVAQRLGHTLGSDFQEFVTVHEMSDIVDALIARAITEALSSLRK